MNRNRGNNFLSSPVISKPPVTQALTLSVIAVRIYESRVR
jgi:hypothetical protein